MKEAQKKGIKCALAGDAKYDSPGFCASFCLYSLQSIHTKKIISLWVAHKSMVTMSNVIFNFILCLFKVSSSGKMEVFAAKTLLMNLAWEHQLVIYSVTTDRSKDMKILMRCKHSLAPCIDSTLVLSDIKWYP